MSLVALFFSIEELQKINLTHSHAKNQAKLCKVQQNEVCSMHNGLSSVPAVILIAFWMPLNCLGSESIKTSFSSYNYPFSYHKMRWLSMLFNPGTLWIHIWYHPINPMSETVWTVVNIMRGFLMDNYHILPPFSVSDLHLLSREGLFAECFISWIVFSESRIFTESWDYRHWQSVRWLASIWPIINKPLFA